MGVRLRGRKRLAPLLSPLRSPCTSGATWGQRTATRWDPISLYNYMITPSHSYTLLLVFSYCCLPAKLHQLLEYVTTPLTLFLIFAHISLYLYLLAKLHQLLEMPSHFQVGSYGQEIHEMTEARAFGMGQYR